MKWFLLIISILLVTGCNEKKEIQNENKAESIKKQQINLDTDNVISIETNSQSNSKDIIQLGEDSQSLISNAKEVEKLTQTIHYLEQDVHMILANESLEAMKEKVIGKLITLIDFIYYDAPIGDLYFKELTANMQAKVKETLGLLDQAIEEKIPNYKETIQEKYQRTLQYTKIKTKEFSNQVGEKIEEKIGSESYQNLIKAKEDLKESFQTTTGYIKEETSKILENGKEKVSYWYQEIKEKYKK